jgi:hypothetical protein
MLVAPPAGRARHDMTSGGKNKAPRKKAPPPVGKGRRNTSRRTWLVAGAAVVVVAVAAGAVVATRSNGGSGVSTRPLSTLGGLEASHLLQTPGPEGIPIPTAPPVAPAGTPSGAPIDGIQCNQTEQVAYHIHARLTVFDHGRARSIPYGIGIAPPREVQKTPAGPFVVGGSCFYWLHTHAADGIIHIESPTTRTYTLGNFFNVWGQPLGPDQVGPLHGKVTIIVNDGVYVGNPRALPLHAHEQIQIEVGSPLIRPVAISGWNGL